MYILHDGSEATRDQIAAAFETGKAVIIHARADHRTVSSLSLDGQQWDTRGQCASMWDESWTETPGSLKQALFVAHC